MPIRAEQQTAHTGSPPVDVIYLISAQDGVYGKELFSVYLRSERDSGHIQTDFRTWGIKV